MLFNKFIEPINPAHANIKPSIDVRNRLSELSQDQLLLEADAYFSNFNTSSQQFKKPFSNPQESIALTQHLGLLFEAAELFRGAKVLDFGCATGWLSVGMAQMGCNVIGLDVSKNAIGLANQLKSQRITTSDGYLDFLIYDGVHLPIADASLDRIVCFDAFHHVQNQLATLQEFSRVLKHGGRVAFVEPGPYHSRTPASQAEMALHKVIENDINIKNLCVFAREAGLNTPQMLVQFQKPIQLSSNDYLGWAEDGLNKKQAKEILKSLLAPLTDTQYFYIQKGTPLPDSRQANYLQGKIELKEIALGKNSDQKIQLKIRLINTGQAIWLTKPETLGQVKIGVQIYDLQNTITNLDYARIALPDPPLKPNESLELTFEVQLPANDQYNLQLDLVAEHVCWFSMLQKLKPVVIQSSQIHQLQAKA